MPELLRKLEGCPQDQDSRHKMQEQMQATTSNASKMQLMQNPKSNQKKDIFLSKKPELLVTVTQVGKMLQLEQDQSLSSPIYSCQKRRSTYFQHTSTLLKRTIFS